jgi:hypothetical protein
MFHGPKIINVYTFARLDFSLSDRAALKEELLRRTPMMDMPL